MAKATIKPNKLGQYRRPLTRCVPFRLVHKFATARVLDLIMKELHVVPQNVDIRNANVRTKQ
eukprot:10665333-Heterocapsa_arctica.AAC.1